MLVKRNSVYCNLIILSIWLRKRVIKEDPEEVKIISLEVLFFLQCDWIRVNGEKGIALIVTSRNYLVL